MSLAPEKLHDLLSYCMDFAKTMLNDAGDFYPFGAVVGKDEKVRAVGGYDGNEHPKPQDIYRLLAEGFISQANEGAILGAALAANVNIPQDYSPPAPDGLRVHLECACYSRFIYIPYQTKKKGFFSKARITEFFEPFAVEIEPAFFQGGAHA